MTKPEQDLMLIDSLRAAGKMSNASLKALGKVDPRRLSLGSPVDRYKHDGVLLVATLIDDSGSLNIKVEKAAGTDELVSRSTSCDDLKSNAEAVRIGHNAVIQALLDTERPSATRFHTRYLHGKELNSWKPLEEAIRMNRDNYRPNDGTPLYDQTIETCWSVLAKMREFRDNWINVRTATLIVTDGADNESELQTPASVKSIITDMYNMGIHIVAAMGINDGSTDFRKVFIEMGIHENLILTPGSTPDEIRKAFSLFGRMASRASDLSRFNDMLTGGFLALPPGER